MSSPQHKPLDSLDHDRPDEVSGAELDGAAALQLDEADEASDTRNDQERRPEGEEDAEGGDDGEGEEEPVEDEEDEEEDEEDEEEEDEGRDSRGRKRRYKKQKRSRFLDVEAEVDDDEEDFEEDEEELAKEEGFIEEDVVEESEEARARRAADHQRFDRERRELEEQDLGRLAEELRDRYARSSHYTSDLETIPQRLLLPSVKDASIYGVSCRPGREREIVASIMNKFMDLQYSGSPLNIISAFHRDSIPGRIYVEAWKQKDITNALNGLVGVYLNRIFLVPIEEMADLLKVKKVEQELLPGTWVRVKRGRYAGDLAQILDISLNGEEVGLKLIPRIDLNPKDEGTYTDATGKKRKKGAAGSAALAFRPAQRLFNAEDVKKAYGERSVAKRSTSYVFQGDTFKEGFLEKDFKVNFVTAEGVAPTLDELTKFAAEDQSVKKVSAIAFRPGDHIEIFEGEQSGSHGIVENVSGDIIAVKVQHEDLLNQTVEVQAKSVRKRFQPGEHIKVMNGTHKDETGLVVAVNDNETTFLSDLTMTEVTVFSNDVQEAAEIGTGANVVGSFELHNLVQLDQQTAGIIFKIERDAFRVLDQEGNIVVVHPHQIRGKIDGPPPLAMDSDRRPIAKGDNMKEIDGEMRQGQVLHIHQSVFAWLHDRTMHENGGIFVTRTGRLQSLAPKATSVDLSKMNPALGGQNPWSAAAVPPPVMSTRNRPMQDRLSGTPVVVVRGPHKQNRGIIKDTGDGKNARVELHTTNKILTIPMTDLRYKDPLTGETRRLEDVGARRGGGMAGPPAAANPYMPAPAAANPYGSAWGGPPAAGGRTPAWGQAARTPNPFAADGGRTPAWNAARTPNPYAADGGRTPAWTARTPNPYANDAGGRTPAWGADGRTPNPYAGDGGRTPAWGQFGRTPNPYAADGGRTPAWNMSKRAE